MKIQVMRLGKTGEDHIVPDYETEDGWFVRLTISEGLVIEISELHGDFALRSINDCMAVLPRADNSIYIKRRTS